MNRHLLTAIGASTLLFTGCVAGEPPATSPGGPSASCDAAPAQSGVGQSYSDALAERLRAASNAREVRRLTPDMVVTMEFRGDRLNVVTDGRDVVSEVRCG